MKHFLTPGLFTFGTILADLASHTLTTESSCLSVTFVPWHVWQGLISCFEKAGHAYGQDSTANAMSSGAAAVACQ